MEKKIPDQVMMRKNIEKRQWNKVRKEDVKNCPTILHHALLRHWDNIVFEKLLERGALVNERNHIDMTPLQFALNYRYNAKLIEILLNHGASVNIHCMGGRTPLQIAIVNNYSAHVIEKMLQCGASVNDTDNFGMDALNLALTNIHCNAAVVEKLLQYGADMKQARHSTCFDYEDIVTQNASPFIHPLIVAVKLNLNKKVIKLLLKYNASPGQSLYQILSGLRRSDEHILPYCINLLTLFAAIEGVEKDLNTFLRMFDGIRNLQYLDFAKSCVSELLHMKELLVGEINNFTLYEFLITKDDQVASVRENKSIINCVFSFLTSGKFPLYNDMILSQLGRRGLENILLDTEVSLKSRFSLCCWDSWLIISKHLSKVDMLNLIVALAN